MSPRFRLIVILICVFWVRSLAHAQMQAADTVLFAKVGGRLCQMVHVKGIPGPVDRWAVETAGSTINVDAKDVQADKDGWLVPIPAVDKPTEVKITAGQSDSITHTAKPQKRWTAYLTPHTHFDLGFTDVQSKVWDQQMDYLHGVIAICDETKDWPRDVQYRWTIECSSLLEMFAERHSADMPKLVELIRQGRVEAAGEYAGLLTELCGGEELCRSFYPVQRFRDRYGISVTTAMHNDIPGITWQMPQLFQGAGIKYLSFRANSIRGKFLWYRPEAPTRPFIWEGPDGSKLMVWYTDRYREANFFRDELPKDTPADVVASHIGGPFNKFLELIARQEAKGTPVDAIQMRMGGDNMSPSINPCKWARAWNDSWVYPRIVVGTNRMFFDRIERFRPRLETHRGDITDWWADGAGSSARETGLNRMSHERTAVAETMSALVGDKGTADTWDLYRNMLLYDEHTFGSSGGLRTGDPANAAEQWRVKSGFAQAADMESRKLLDQASGLLADAVRDDKADRLVVWNPSSWPRSGVVEVQLPAGHAAFDPKSGHALQAKRVGDHWAVRVDDIPSLGWKAYTVKPGSFAVMSEAKQNSAAAGPIQYIYETGAKRESVNPASGVPKYDKKWSALDLKPGERLNGPPGSKWVEISVSSVGPGRQDIRVEMDKPATEEPEAVYLEFPFDLGKPTVHVGIPFGWMNAASDRLPCTCADFFSIDRAVDLNDGRRGITLAAVEAPLIEFGNITTDAWSEKLIVDKPVVYSYIMNNYWFTNYQFSQGGPYTFRYAIRRYDGPFSPLAASRFGEEVARPLEARLVSPGKAGKWAGVSSWSAVNVRPDNVIVVAAKPAEDGRGVILRLAESAGRDADVRITIPGLGSGAIWRCTLLEKDVERIGSNGPAGFRIGAWQIVTLRVMPEVP